eukprot:370024_1
MSDEHGFNKLDTIPLRCDCYHPKPLFYPHNSNEIIVSTDCDEVLAGIYKYNINTNSAQLLHEYDKYQTDRHGHFIDYKNEILYVFGGGYDVFNAFNLKTNTMTDMG